MNNIYTNSDSSINNYFINKKNYNINKISLQSKSTTNVTKDSVSNNNLIQISEKNENLINAKQAKAALDYTLNEFSYDETKRCEMMADLNAANFLMECDMNKTPLSTNCLEQSFSFTDYADNLVKYAEKLQKTSPGFFPSNFVDFCKKYQENLKNFGCK